MSDNGLRLAANMPEDRTKYYDASQFNLGKGTLIPKAVDGEFDGRSSAIDHNKPVKLVVDPGKSSTYTLDFASMPIELKDKVIRKVMNDTSLTNPEQRLNAINQEIANLTKEVKQAETAPEPPSLGFNKQAISLTTPGSFQVRDSSGFSGIPTAGNVAPSFSVATPVSNFATESVLKAQLAKYETDLKTYQAEYNRLLEAYNQVSASTVLLEQIRADYAELWDAYTALREKAEVTPAKPFSVLPDFGPEPKAPTNKVIFKFPTIGHLSSMYHNVLIQDKVLVLIYDTRFEYGVQYLPPALEDQSITLDLISNSAEGTKTLVVGSIGLNVRLGCLDVVVLFIESGV